MRKNGELVAQGTHGRFDEQNINLVLKLFLGGLALPRDQNTRTGE